jgi:hypothetical protein
MGRWETYFTLFAQFIYNERTRYIRRRIGQQEGEVMLSVTYSSQVY